MAASRSKKDKKGKKTQVSRAKTKLAPAQQLALVSPISICIGLLNRLLSRLPDLPAKWEPRNAALAVYLRKTSVGLSWTDDVLERLSEIMQTRLRYVVYTTFQRVFLANPTEVLFQLNAVATGDGGGGMFGRTSPLETAILSGYPSISQVLLPFLDPDWNPIDGLGLLQVDLLPGDIVTVQHLDAFCDSAEYYAQHPEVASTREEIEEAYPQIREQRLAHEDAERKQGMRKARKPVNDGGPIVSESIGDGNENLAEEPVGVGEGS